MNRLQYEDLCEYSLGRAGYYLVTVSMFIFAYGAMVRGRSEPFPAVGGEDSHRLTETPTRGTGRLFVQVAYFIVIGDTVPLVLELAFNATGLVATREFSITIGAVVFILPLCLLRVRPHMRRGLRQPNPSHLPPTPSSAGHGQAGVDVRHFRCVRCDDRVYGRAEGAGDCERPGDLGGFGGGAVRVHPPQHGVCGDRCVPDSPRRVPPRACLVPHTLTGCAQAP